MGLESALSVNNQGHRGDADPGAVRPKGKVLFITPQPFFTHRGSPFRVRSTVSALLKLGYEVDLLVLPFGEDIELPGLRIFRSWSLPGLRSVSIGPSWSKMGLDALMLLKAIQLSLRTNYTAVHGVEEGGIIATVLKSLRGTPYVFDMHSCMSEQLEYSKWVRSKTLLSLFRSLERVCIRRASAVMTVGTNHTLVAKRVAPHIPAYPLHDLPLDSQEVISNEALFLLRESLGLSGRRVLLYTGNFEPYQGIELLLRSFSLAIERVGETNSASPVLVLVGGGEGYQAAHCPYQRLAHELGLSASVRFIGQRPMHEMGAFMAMADVFLSPRTEGQNTPLKIYSYMAAEKPIVATRISSHTQALDDDSGLLGDPHPDAFAEALLSVLDDSEMGNSRIAAKVRRAKELVETIYSPQEFSRKLLEMYDIVHGRSPC